MNVMLFYFFSIFFSIFYHGLVDLHATRTLLSEEKARDYTTEHVLVNDKQMDFATFVEQAPELLQNRTHFNVTFFYTIKYPGKRNFNQGRVLGENFPKEQGQAYLVEETDCSKLYDDVIRKLMETYEEDQLVERTWFGFEKFFTPTIPTHADRFLVLNHSSFLGLRASYSVMCGVSEKNFYISPLNAKIDLKEHFNSWGELFLVNNALFRILHDNPKLCPFFKHITDDWPYIKKFIGSGKTICGKPFGYPQEYTPEERETLDKDMKSYPVVATLSDFYKETIPPQVIHLFKTAMGKDLFPTETSYQHGAEKYTLGFNNSLLFMLFSGKIIGINAYDKTREHHIKFSLSDHGAMGVITKKGESGPQEIIGHFLAVKVLNADGDPNILISAIEIKKENEAENQEIIGLMSAFQKKVEPKCYWPIESFLFNDKWSNIKTKLKEEEIEMRTIIVSIPKDYEESFWAIFHGNRLIASRFTRINVIPFPKL
jgi:hypothetical protein